MAKEPYYIKHVVSVRLTLAQQAQAVLVAKKLGKEETLSEGVRAAIEYAVKTIPDKDKA